ncbi:MAG: multicopper oxidase domain-containing protein [Gammaproteobacteria bacterium]|nr:multicopper oxidase domain-containing protein [Gammaproteobacteria bacterium]MBU1724281.1 multicopper oxidase domain-containing protein [Gammaproteobacteria bacterium]MBU2006291.1 multicopper oxidase domain-containing protein [Gammaproteobacteria bacterium]
MHSRTLRIAALTLTSLLVLSACGGGGSTPASTPATTLTGSAFKGPMDNAQVNILDAAGKILATSTSSSGKFTLSGMTLPADDAAVFIQTSGGHYTDEATGLPVNPVGGLKTVFTVADLQAVIDSGTVIALTPETTIMATLVQKYLTDGKTAAQAIADAKALVQAQLIDGTNPAPGVTGDTLLLTGDLSRAIPANTAEALARNRAISFSYEAQDKSLTPAQAFELINLTARDLEDGTLDGKAGTEILTLSDDAGNTVDLSLEDRQTRYGLARTRLLGNTLTRLASGSLSAAEQAELAQLGFDTSLMTQTDAANQAAEANTVANLAATNLPAFNHLPVLADEDGNTTDNLATYTLTATPNVNVTINTPGATWVTPMSRYNGLELPPIIKAKRGQVMTLNLQNNLPEATTIHWHGFKIPGDQDGGPDFPVAASGSKSYGFTLSQPAAPLWFHPHPDMKTAEQVYRGLAGVFLLTDSISEQLETTKQLPTGAYDIPVLVQDRRFAAEENGIRNLAYKTLEMDSDGMLGDDILVNGAELPKLVVETRQYRFRLYNASNARAYDFALSNGAKFKVIGTDGGLLPAPVETDHIVLGAAERAEIVVDFRQYAVGDKIMLVSRAFPGDAMNLMTGMDGSASMGDMTGMGSSGSMGDMTGMGDSASMDGVLPNGRYMDIMRFDVATQAGDDVTLYATLPAEADINAHRLQASDASKTRNFVLTMQMGNMGSATMDNMRFVINGKTFDMNRIDETISLAEGNTEIWSIQNMSPMAHPFHAHAIQWQVLDRNGIAATGTDLGWKDTVLVQPGETANLIGRFDPSINYGDYMYHCHILEHEDAGMMGFFRITQ